MQTLTVVTADELSEQIEQILRRVRDEGETVEIVDHGKVVARLEPTVKKRLTPDEAAQLEARWAMLDRLAAEIDARRQQGGAGNVSRPTQAERDAIWAERERLAAEISAEWPKGVSAAEAIAEDRREL